MLYIKRPKSIEFFKNHKKSVENQKFEK